MNISSKIMRIVVSKFIAKEIKKKTGSKMKVGMNDISIKDVENNRIKIHIDADVEITEEDLMRLLQIED